MREYESLILEKRLSLFKIADMKTIGFISAIFFFVSCTTYNVEESDAAILSDRIRLEISSDESLNHLDVLMNKEMTDMTLPWIVEGATDRLSKDDNIQNRFTYNILSCLESRQMGNYSKAYDYILEAQEITEKDKDLTKEGQIMLGRYLISQYLNDYKTAVDQILKASEYFKKNNNNIYEYNNYLLEAIRGYILLGKYDFATGVLDVIGEKEEKMSPPVKSKYYDSLLNLYRYTDISKIPEILDIISEEIDSNYVYWLNIAYSYSIIGQNKDASDAIEKYLIYNKRFGKSAAYYGIRAYVMENIGSYEEALNCYKNYISKVENEYQELLDSDIHLKEYRMKTEIEELKYRQLIIILGLCVIISLLLIYFYKRRLNIKQEEVNSYNLLINKAEEEIKRLKLMYDNKTLDNKVREALKQRLNIFNQYTLGKISPNYSTRSAEEKLRFLINSKDMFLESTCKAFEAINPEFTAFLASCNLTERERGCCCLYCMGMRGNEIAAYMGLTDQSYYNFSSIIRKKLGLKEYKTNLDIFLKNKIEELNYSLIKTQNENNN